MTLQCAHTAESRSTKIYFDHIKKSTKAMEREKRTFDIIFIKVCTIEFIFKI